MADAVPGKLKKGFDATKRIYCEPCGNILADAFCNDCLEYLCSHCANLHEKQRMSKHHTLLRGSNMPMAPLSTAVKLDSNAGPFQKCAQHPNEELKLFCETHGSACCSACSVSLHKQCDVIYIPDAAKDYKTGPEYRKLVDDVKGMEQLAAKYLTDIEKNMKSVDKQEADHLAMLDKYRVEIIAFVEKRVKELSSQIQQLRIKNTALLKEKQSKSRKFQAKLSAVKSKLTTSEQNHCELFTECKNAISVVAQLQSELADIADNTHFQQYQFQKDANMEAVLGNKAGVATLELIAGWLLKASC